MVEEVNAYLIKRNDKTHPYLVEEDGKYLWGIKDDAVHLSYRDAKRIKRILGFPVKIELKESNHDSRE